MPIEEKFDLRRYRFRNASKYLDRMANCRYAGGSGRFIGGTIRKEFKHRTHKIGEKILYLKKFSLWSVKNIWTFPILEMTFGGAKPRLLRRGKEGRSGSPWASRAFRRESKGWLYFYDCFWIRAENQPQLFYPEGIPAYLKKRSAVLKVLSLISARRIRHGGSLSRMSLSEPLKSSPTVL